MYNDFDECDEIEKLDNIEAMEKQKNNYFFYARAILASLMKF